MKHRLYRKEANKKTIALLIGTCFLTLSINQCIANPEPLMDRTSLCYGFIIPIVKSDNWTIDDQTNCKNRHLVNDLLRENISVFWSSANITTFIRKIDDGIEQEMFFQKGTFIIPFTGNDTQDIKLIAIIYDYNQSSEIENDEMRSPVYLLIQPLFDLQIYPLSEVKIAQYEPITINGSPYWLELATNSGFLTFEFLDEKDIKAKKLNLIDFNVVMWPGGGNTPFLLFNTEYKLGKNTGNMFHSITMKIYHFLKILAFNVYKEIREFVAYRGGYIGSCYGCMTATAWSNFPLNTPPKTDDQLNLFDKYFLGQAHNPKSFAFYNLAISDTFTTGAYLGMGQLKAKIVNDSHPVAYGLDRIVPDVHWSGGKFLYIGENSQEIAQFYNAKNSTWDGNASWVSSKFGKGRVVLSSTHPEYVNKTKNTFMSNSWYYTTCGEINKLNTNHTKNLSFIDNVWETTANLTDETNETGKIFDEIIKSNDININEMKNLIHTLNRILDLIRDIAKYENVPLENESRFFLEYDGLNDSRNFFDLFIRYLENTSITLSTFEKIYPLLENDTEFVQQIKMLKSDLWWRINATRYMLSKSQEISKNYEKLTKNYGYFNDTQLGKDFRYMLAIHNEFKLGRQAKNGFQYLPQIYLNSLKLLRSSWYNYETSIVL